MIKNNYPTIRPSLDLNFAGSKTVDPRITFTRASTATYYDGKTFAKAEENLWFPSAQVLTFGASLVTITQNATTAPDGTQTAGLVVPTTASGFHVSGYRSTSPANADQIFSFYAKPAGYDKVRVGELALGVIYATFDLTSGTGSATGGTALLDFGVVDAGNGWKRCWIKFNAATNVALVTTPFPTGAPVDGYGRFNGVGDGTSGVYFWGYQLEQRSSLTAYTPTTDQPITRYQPVLLTAPANTPRIVIDPVTGECKGLLNEEQRTNLLTYSEQFSNAAWTKNNCSIAANTLIAPDGTLSADKVIEDLSSSVSHDVRVFGTQVTEYTVSVYAKAGERKWLKLTNEAGGVCFDLGNGVVGSYAGTGAGSAAIFNVGNGWYRCSVKLSSAASGTMYLIGPIQSDATLNYAGDGVSGIYIWGAQLEAGAFPTSYIKTEASQVTRAADNPRMTGANFSSWYRQDEGSIVTEFSPIGSAAIDTYQWRIIRDSENATDDAHNLRTSNGVAISTTYSSEALQSQLSFGSVPLTGTKIAYAYKTNDFIGSKDGANAITGTIGTVPTALHTLLIGSSGCNYIKRIVYYPKRLSNTQLQALTA